MQMIVGLGNPGAKYENTRHNLGFLCIDELSRRWCISLQRQAYQAQVGLGNVKGETVMLVKPKTFMNHSGISVRGLLGEYDVPLDSLMVVYDDLDLPTGSIRLRAKGGPGGHRGVRSIIQHTGCNDFPRLRLGIGPRPEGVDAAEYVLAVIGDDLAPTYRDAIFRGADALECWSLSGIDAVMNAYN